MNSRNLQLREGGNGVIYVTSDFFPNKKVVLGFSTRFGGVSSSPYNSLNLGYSVADRKENVQENRRRFVTALNRDLDKTVIGNQVHGDNLFEVTLENSWYENYLEDSGAGIADTDGLLTRVSGISLLGSFADCVPIYFYEPNIPMVGLTHAGWRGTCKYISFRTVDKIEAAGGTLQDIKVIIGPSIGPCCYQVGEELYKAWYGDENREKLFFDSKRKLFLDLWKANQLQLIDRGIDAENILVGNMCTACNRDIFFSHRIGGTNTGRMMGLISLK